MNKEICWALIALMDGVQYHDLPGMGFSDAECERIWEATQEAKNCYNDIEKKVTTETDLTKTVTTETELRQKIELQNKQISLLLQSMKQEREERRQKGEQREQRLSLAVSRMVLQLQKLNK